jgi:ATP-dependent Clp protease ATP-binding subunit ClpC
MYKSWAARRGMQLQEYAREPPLITVSGFGAYACMAREAGLHVLEPPEGEDGGPRLVARVRVAAAPLGELAAATAAKTLATTLAAEPASSTVVRRYRGGRSPLVRDARLGWRSGKLEAILGGDFDLIGAAQRAD